MNFYKKIILVFIFVASNLFCQELGLFSNKNKSSIVFSGSINNDFGVDLESSSNQIKLNFKSKSPFEFWASILENDSNNSNVNQIGFGYLINKKKWGLTLFINRNEYVIKNDSVETEKISFELGWMINFKKKTKYIYKI